jgi:hypothetical protein
MLLDPAKSVLADDNNEEVSRHAAGAADALGGKVGKPIEP